MYYQHKMQTILKKKNVNFVVHSYLGPVPVELDEMYPLAQSLFPRCIDKETEDYIQQVVDKFLKGSTVIRWTKGLSIKPRKSRPEKIDLDLRRISAVADMQFGTGAAQALFNGEVTVIKSKQTGKIRNIICDKAHVVSMRAEDGLFTLKLDGGRRLHSKFKYPFLRVVVRDDAVSFIREGKSVFAKFVKDCDENLRPFDECLIVDEHDSLLAVGRTVLNRDEMLAFRHGMAVKTRESIK
jgi:7-cyano-7-deazaguanine tRNA-ribosyltransferase